LAAGRAIEIIKDALIYSTLFSSSVILIVIEVVQRVGEGLNR
jgi:hypothetical protein